MKSNNQAKHTALLLYPRWQDNNIYTEFRHTGHLPEILLCVELGQKPQQIQATKKKSQPPNPHDVKRPAIQQEPLFSLRTVSLPFHKICSCKTASQAKFGSLHHLNKLVVILWGKKMWSLLIKRIASPPNELPKKVARIPNTNVKEQFYLLLIKKYPTMTNILQYTFILLFTTVTMFSVKFNTDIYSLLLTTAPHQKSPTCSTRDV